MGFLGLEETDKLQRIFSAKRSNGKLKIEVGLHELRLTKKYKEIGYYGEQMVLSLWKPPAHFDDLKNPIPYQTIDLIHVLRKERYGSFKENWIKPFTTCLDEKSFDVLKTGDTFLCLVEQSEKMFERDGEIQVYRKGNKVGDDIVLVDSTIRKVYPQDYDRSKIKVDYINLYKFLE